MSKQVIAVEDEVLEKIESDAYPVFIPSIAVMVSCADKNGKANIIPIVGWTVVSRFPFMVAIALCHGEYTSDYFPRYSHQVILETGEFVLNIPHVGLRESISETGSVSGKDPAIDKFKMTGLTPGQASSVNAPIITECPINLECKVVDVVRTGSHDLFIGRVTAVQTDPILNQEICDDCMMIDLLLDPDCTGEPRPYRIEWRTLLPLTKQNSADP